MSKLTLLGILTAILAGIVHGFCEGMYRLAVDEDWEDQKASRWGA